MSADLSLASGQIFRIGLLCDFLEHPGLAQAVATSIPVSMPATAGSMGFDEPTWVGLGMVGLWAALDSYAARSGVKGTCTVCRRPGCLFGRINSTGRLDASDSLPLQELEDLRHLFAHNFADQADTQYLTFATRHVLTAAHPIKLSSAAVFDGLHLTLTSKDLRHYANHAKNILSVI